MAQEKRELRFKPWPLMQHRDHEPDTSPVGNKHNPDGSVNYAYLDRGEWWNYVKPGHCLNRGFVSDARFQKGTEQIIPRTNRAAQRNRK